MQSYPSRNGSYFSGVEYNPILLEMGHSFPGVECNPIRLEMGNYDFSGDMYCWLLQFTLLSYV
jgi:hypothetical protein